MANVLIPVGNIHTGFWTDWSQGSVLGYRLTLGPTQTMLLTSSLAATITLCGIHLWTFVRYILYQHANAIRKEAPTPHLKRQQIILRNTDSALTTARLMLGLACFKRNSKGKVSSRALVTGIIAFLFACSFVAFAILSTQMIVVGKGGYSPVLLRNRNCGVWNPIYENIVTGSQVTNETEFGLLIENRADLASDIQFSLEYAQECYFPNKGTTDASTNCQILRKPSVGNNSWLSSTCPFESELCRETANTIEFHTGSLNSHTDFGINAKPENRLTYTRSTRCAVLNDAADPGGWNGTIIYNPNSQSVPQQAHAYFGHSLTEKTPWTYAHSNFAAFYNNFSAKVTNPYQVDVEFAIGKADPQWTSSTFVPLPGLTQKSADLSLIFLSFAGTYLEAVDDPWFSAHTPYNFSVGAPFTRLRYAHDKAISAIGCTEQHQFCTSNGTCTGMLGFDQVQNIMSFNHALNSQQNATFDRMIRAVGNSLIFYVISALSKTTTPLRASTLAANGQSSNIMSVRLPDNQWKLELQNWHSIAMAHLQRTIVEWATGQIVPDSRWLLPPQQEQDVWFCENMVILSAFYTSFRMISIVVIIYIGLLIVISSIFVEDLVALARKWFRRPLLESRWNYDDILEMQPTRPHTLRAGLSRSSLTQNLKAISIHHPQSKTCNSLGFRRITTSSGRASSQALPDQDTKIQANRDQVQGSSREQRPGKHFRIHAQTIPQPVAKPMRNSRINISLSDLELTPEERSSSRLQWECNPRRMHPLPASHPLHTHKRPCNRIFSGATGPGLREDRWI